MLTSERDHLVGDESYGRLGETFGFRLRKGLLGRGAFADDRLVVVAQGYPEALVCRRIAKKPHDRAVGVTKALTRTELSRTALGMFGAHCVYLVDHHVHDLILGGFGLRPDICHPAEDVVELAASLCAVDHVTGFSVTTPSVTTRSR